ncbi:MAG: hypothetical protein ACJ8EF_04025 [Bradyrhizobium sp.]|jgi:hypothetical protein
MFARKAVCLSIGRATVMASVAALAVTAFEPSPARAASAAPGLSTATADAGLTDVSARRRVYRRGGGAAAAAAFAGIVGTGIAIAASQNRRHYYDGYYGPRYDSGPGYYSGGPAYYGGGPYYGGGYYRGW